MIAQWILRLSDLLFWPYAAIFLVSCYLTFKSKFIQIRVIKKIPRLLSSQTFRLADGSKSSVSPLTALSMAMSTGIGLGNIFGPIWAVSMGGPVALLGFLFSAFLGSVVTFCEVSLAVSNRTHTFPASGPMAYIRIFLGRSFGLVYAWGAFVLLTCWSATQAGTFADLIYKFGIPKLLTAVLLSIFIISVLAGGARRIGKLANAIVPAMLVLFILATLKIIVVNIDKVPDVLRIAAKDLFPAQKGFFSNLLTGFGLHTALRWGFAKGIQASESGVGTAAFPHGASQGSSAIEQAELSILGVFSTIIVCALSGLSYLVGTSSLGAAAPTGPHVFAQILSRHFTVAGPAIFVFCAFLFSFGTIIGNSFNSSQCFSHIFGRDKKFWFYGVCAIAVFVGCLTSLGWLWTIPDFFVLPVIATNIAAILVAVKKGKVGF